jgi:hypothetical protein
MSATFQRPVLFMYVDIKHWVRGVLTSHMATNHSISGHFTAKSPLFRAKDDGSEWLSRIPNSR